MKIDINHIPFEGQTIEEEIVPSDLELETDLIKFRGNIKVKADLSKITNAVTANLNISGLIYANCSRCLEEFQMELAKNIKLNYPVSSSDTTIDLSQDIKDEIVLDYPMRPLCNSECKGLCIRCGKNLNEGSCNCGAA
ncbi:MAG: DUF177 domain-containing protein [Candidatus Omnitrophica bacterium]|nr:DUF177 domain-containing protein [Candidatus Omnitrophota bacterium]MBU1091047.1 DUF177 domain-containing protein [Candidatus Omnitrophota bacterium]MBU1905393.1 DUF177 domain-containing protein [Candidatus Omnitrophota bacterium]